MEVKNALVPNDEQMKGFMEGDIDTPGYMVNLLKFRDKAAASRLFKAYGL